MSDQQAITRRFFIEQPFDLDRALYGAQDFRWRPWRDGWKSGVLSGNLMHVRKIDGGVEYRSAHDLDSLLTSYFRLGDDIDDIHRDLSSRDDRIARLVRKYPYLRILRQPDHWECMVAYICSANANIQKTTRSVEAIAQELGDRIGLDDDVRHAFPTPEKVLEAGVKTLAELRLGLDRHSKIIAAANRIADGTLDLDYLSQPQVCYAEAKRRLMVCRGIGDKVADCITLFALDKIQAFPVDTHVESAVKAHYFPRNVDIPAGDELVMWAQDRFGKYAGYANQLLFQEEYENRRTKS